MHSIANNVVEYEKFDGTLILFNTSNAKYICVSPDMRGIFNTVYHELSANSDIEKKIMKRLIDDQFVVYDKEASDNSTKDIGNGKVLHLTIMPTENCNFRCIYCFEHHKTNFMSQTTQDALVESVDKIIDGYESLFVNWYGGEPLLYIPTIEYLSEKLMGICNKKKKSYMASMTTNGYNLTYPTYLKMRLCNIVSFTVTIDGVKEDHNHYRISELNGGDTYSVIMNNLKEIKEREKSHLVHFTIRTNFTKKTVANKSEWEEILKKTFLDDDRYSYLPRIAWNGTDEECLKDDILDVAFSDNLSPLDKLPLSVTKENETIVDDIIPQSIRKDERLKKNIESELEALVNGSFICGAGYKSTMTINPEGEILKCQVNLDADYNVIGRVNIETGRFDIDADKSRLWDFGNIEQKCKSCNLFPCCKGIGCPMKVRSQSWCSDLYGHIVRRLIALTYCHGNYTRF